MCHGSPARSTAARMPPASRAPRRCVCAYASGVRISSIVARAAAIERALPKSVPPVATRCDALAVGALAPGASRSAIASVMPQAPNGMPPAIDLPIVTRSGSRPQAAVSPPAPTTWVCVSSQARSVPVSRVSRRSASWNPASGQDQPDGCW